MSDKGSKRRGNTKYLIAKDGEWLRPRYRAYMLKCCDCGLVHKINFRLVKIGVDRRVIEFQAFRQGKLRKKAR